MMTDTTSTQIEILEQLLFGDFYPRIMAMTQERTNTVLTKALADEPNAFVNLSRFELRFIMWHSLSLMTGYEYQPAETQAESDMEAQVYRQFWAALLVYTTKRFDHD